MNLKNVINIITKNLVNVAIKNQSLELDEHDFIPHLVSETADISFRHTDTHGILRSDSEQGVTLSMLYTIRIDFCYFSFSIFWLHDAELSVISVIVFLLNYLEMIA